MIARLKARRRRLQAERDALGFWRVLLEKLARATEKGKDGYVEIAYTQVGRVQIEVKKLEDDYT